MTEGGDLEKILNVILSGNDELLENLIVQLWVAFFGPRDIYRELKLQQIDDKTAVFAIHSVRIDISGSKFMKHLVALEIGDKVFIDKEIISDIDLKRFLESVNEGLYPRVIMDRDFRKKFGIPQTLAEHEIRVIGIALIE